MFTHTYTTNKCKLKVKNTLGPFEAYLDAQNEHHYFSLSYQKTAQYQSMFSELIGDSFNTFFFSFEIVS